MSPDSTPTLAPLATRSRLSRLRDRLATDELDCLLVGALANIRYLTGFTGSAAQLLVTAEAALLVTDGRYRTQADEQLDAAGVSDTVEIFVGRVPAQNDSIVDLVRRTIPSDGGRVGLEADHVVWAQKRSWKELLPPVELVATSGIVEALRTIKDLGEIARIELAASYADAALREVAPMIGRGHSESEVALALDVAMRRLGAEDRAFETIVASGPNSAKPHARPGNRMIVAGDSVVVDFGAMVDGYRSDMTRTFLAGDSPSEKIKEVYDAVLRAQRAGVMAVRAGIPAGDVDEACRKSLSDVGLGEAFEHGTGHGVGLDIHEAPSVGPGSTGILEAGAVVTVEPGAYLAGLGGVRIEDTVVVTADGCRTLTSFTKSYAVP
jgi:Xaa-Pro aminopeptidase